VNAVVVAPSEHHSALHGQAERFGLAELRTLLPPGESEIGSIRQALAALPGAPDDVILVHHGLHALCPVAMTARVLGAAGKHGAAVATRPLQSLAFGAGDTLGVPVTDALVTAQWPAAFTRAALDSVVALPLEGPLLAAASVREGGVSTVTGDRDLFALEDEADLTRALEAWGRRATEYAFIWPRPADDHTQLHARNELNLTIPDAPAGE